MSRRRTVAMIIGMLLVPAAAALSAHALLPSRSRLSSSGASLAASSAPRPAEPEEDRTPEIRGRILDADGNAVHVATIHLVTPRPPYDVLGETTSDRLGGFSFAHVAPRPARVVAHHEPGGIVSSAELHPAEGQSTDVTLVLSATSGVQGTVVDLQQRPIAGVTLSVDPLPWVVPSATTDASGAFNASIVPYEATSLLAVARGYQPARVALPPRASGVVAVVRVALTPELAAHGEVHGVDDEPVRANVVACAGQPHEARTVSAADGSFELPPSAIGCEVVAQHAEYAASDPAVVVAGRRTLLRLKTGGSIEGVVVDDRGSGVRSFSLGIESFVPASGGSFRKIGARTFEDPLGAFRLEKLAPGTYVLAASAPDKPATRSDPLEVRAGVVTRGARIVLTRGGSVTGRVFDEHQAPLAGVDLRFDMVSSAVESSASTKTGDGGHYRLDGAPAGAFTLRVHKEGFRLRLISGLRVASGGSLAKDITLTVASEGAGFELGGIGAGLVPSDGAIQLGAVFPGNPAARAGLQTGDRILSIDGESSDGMSVADAIQRLRGEPATSVGVSVLRPKTGERFDVVIVRGTIVR